jgi:hypothetical protein
LGSDLDEVPVGESSAEGDNNSTGVEPGAEEDEINVEAEVPNPEVTSLLDEVSLAQPPADETAPVSEEPGPGLAEAGKEELAATDELCGPTSLSVAPGLVAIQDASPEIPADNLNNEGDDEEPEKEVSPLEKALDEEVIERPEVGSGCVPLIHNTNTPIA